MMLTDLMMKKIRDTMLFMSSGQKQIMALGIEAERRRVLGIVKKVHSGKTHSLGARCDWCEVVEEIEKGK